MGISRRAYAKQRGISESMVRKYIAQGTLTPQADGTVDPEAADRELANTVTRGQAEPVVLRTARQRHLRAKVRQLQDRIDRLRRQLIRPEDARAICAEQHRFIAARFRQMPGDARALAGMSPTKAVRAMKDIIADALEYLETNDPPEDNAPKGAEVVPIDIDRLTPVQLQAHYATLQAVELEIERCHDLGELVEIEEEQLSFEEGLTVCKSIILSIPGRVAQLVQEATPEEAVALVAAEVELAIEALT
jgi:hypothetical protein